MSEKTAIKCRLSPHGIRYHNPEKPYRLGIILRENKKGNAYFILWDGNKHGEYYGKTFVEIIKEDETTDNTTVRT